MNVWIDGMTVKVTCRTPELVNNQLKAIDGGRFDTKNSCWSFPLERYDSLVRLRNEFNGHVGLKPVQINSTALAELKHYLGSIGYCASTINNYKRHLAAFLKFTAGKNDQESVNRYMNYLQEERCMSAPYVRGAQKAIDVHLKIEEKKSLGTVF